MYTKQSWIHDGKRGERSLGHFDCECGRRVQAGYYDREESFPCECGITYDGHGWILVRGSTEMTTDTRTRHAASPFRDCVEEFDDSVTVINIYGGDGEVAATPRDSTRRPPTASCSPAHRTRWPRWNRCFGLPAPKIRAANGFDGNPRTPPPTPPSRRHGGPHDRPHLHPLRARRGLARAVRPNLSRTPPQLQRVA